MADLGKIAAGIAMTAGILAAAAPAYAAAGQHPRYALPPSKAHIEDCQNRALQLHPGIIDELHIVPQPKTFWTRYQILMPDGTEWSVVCDLADGHIILDKALVDQAQK